MKDITISIIGRPNVGKSTLFNALIGKNLAITHGKAGVTRDRQYGTVIEKNIRYIFIDTGGYDNEKNHIIEKIREQTLFAITESDIAIMVVDGKVGLMPTDEDIAEIIRKHNKPVILVINKVDNDNDTEYHHEFHKLGIKNVISVSAAHRKNIDKLRKNLYDISKNFNSEEVFKKSESDNMSIAIIGLPNAGKSSLVNFLVGETRMVVSEIPGTTRDSVDSEIVFHGLKINLIDTAGLRQKRKVTDKLEVFSVLRTIKSVERSDITILLIDSQRGITNQDQKIAALVRKKKKCLIVAFNKIDLIDNRKEFIETMKDQVKNKFNFYPDLLTRFISIKNGINIGKLIDDAFAYFQRYRATIQTSRLNKIVQEIMEMELPGGMKNIKIFYGVQTGTRPPSFKFFINSKKYVNTSFIRFLEKQITKKLDLQGVPIKIELTERK